MDPILKLAVVITVLGVLTLVGILGISIAKRRNAPRVVRAFKFLLGVTHFLVMLAGAYLVFYDMASRVFSAEKLLEVWQDKRAVYTDLAKWLIMPALIILLTPILMLRELTAWGRCPYCGRFPVRREIDRASTSGSWSCRKSPQHTGPVGIHWWSKPQKAEGDTDAD